MEDSHKRISDVMMVWCCSPILWTMVFW